MGPPGPTARVRLSALVPALAIALAIIAPICVAPVCVAQGDASAPCAVPLGMPPLVPGQEIRFRDSAFVARATLAEPPDGTGWVVELDLYARPIDPTTRRSRAGSYLPWLDVRYALSAESDPRTAGRLTFRRAAEGPAYGTRLVLKQHELDEARLLTLTVGRRERRYEADPSAASRASACPSLPLTLSLRLDPADLPLPPSDPGLPKASQDNLRLELLGSLNPRPADGYSDIWGYDDGTTQLAIVGSRRGTLFVDVTDPAQPLEVGYVPGPTSAWRDIKTYRHYAYIVTEGIGVGEGLQIVSLEDPASPRLVNTFNLTFTTAHNIYIDEAQGRAWCFGTDNATRVLDLATDPESPLELGAFSERYVHDGYARGGLAYLSEIRDGRQEIVDASDLSSIQPLSSFETPGGKTHNCWPNEDETILAVTDEVDGGHVTLWDISSKTGPNPRLGAYVANPASIVHNVIYDDDHPARAVVSHYTLATKYVDLHRPSFPVELGSYDSFPASDVGSGGVWGVYPFDPRGYIYASDLSTGLYVFEYAPTGGTLSGVVRDAQAGEAIQAVSLVELNSGQRVDSRADGVYAFYIDAGDFALRVSAPGYRTQVIEDGNMPLDGRVDLDIELQPHARRALTGKIRRAADLTPVAGARVRVVGLPQSTTTAADGSYGFPAVGIGQRVVTVEAFGLTPHDERVVLQPGTPETVLDIELVAARFVDDVEQDRGWTLGGSGDTAPDGVWVRVDPNATGGGLAQPEDDHTPDPGALAFITGQSSVGAPPEASDVDGGTTTLTSPILDAAGMGAAALVYHRWLSSDFGFLDGGNLRAQVSADDGATWVTTELVTESAPVWQRVAVDLDDVVPLTGQLRLRFRAEGIATFTTSRILECGIDDIELVSACRSRFSPERPDFDADGQIDACDPCSRDGADDADGDGLCGDVDNAPFASNPDQLDTDGDGIGDAADNCDVDPNPDQRDLDRDGQGDACDGDVDGDGLGNVLDDDIDDDGILGGLDNCPTVRDARGVDRDGDGEGDLCDADDGVVGDVRLDTDVILWAHEQGAESYNVYRGDLGHRALVPQAVCLATDVTTTQRVDRVHPTPGDGFFYLVTQVAAGAEGSPGFTSAGEPRFLQDACP